MENCNTLTVSMNPGVKLQVEMNSPETDSTYYCSLVGSLIHLNITRWDIMFAVFNCSRFMSKPHETNLQATRNIL